MKRLELTWIGKEQRPRLEPRILLEDPEKSYHAAERVTEGDVFDNRLIFGDNLLALKALEHEFAGAVQLAYLDPPYNTRAAMPNYDDDREHSDWLSMMKCRLEVIERLLCPTGIACVQIDDSEGAYLKALMDEVFGRERYLCTFYVQVRYPDKTLKEDMVFHKLIEQVHCYSKGASPLIRRRSKAYGYEKFCWYIKTDNPSSVLQLGGKRVEIFEEAKYTIQKGEPSLEGLKEIWATGTILDGNSSGRFFRDYLSGRAKVDGLGCLYRVQGIGDDGLGYRYFTGPKRENATKGKYFQGIPESARNDEGRTQEEPIANFLDMAGAFGNCRHEGGVEFRAGKKPEALLADLIQYFSMPGQLVLDSFAGSGTTGATAHKLGRRWIMVELLDSCHTHILPRMMSVIDGSDQSGASSMVNWKGGGGFRYYRMAPSLLRRDRYGQWVINPEYNAEMLAEAMCKHMGFTYAPSEEVYWMHGRSTETDFIYVTTQTLTHEALGHLSEEIGEGRTLLVCCAAYLGNPAAFQNLTVQKIPNAVLNKCEFGHDDYSLQVQNLPMRAPEPPPDVAARTNGKAWATPDMFADEEGAK